MLVPSSFWSISIMLSGASGPARAARLVEDGAMGRSPHGWARGLAPAAFTIKFGFGVEHVMIFAGAPANVGVACGEILVARHSSARDGAKQSRIAAFAALRALRLTHAKSARCSFAQCLP